MSITAGNNFISSMGLIANSNLQQAKFDKAATVVKNANTDEDKKKALQQFEGMFISEMMKLMFNTVKTDENFGGGQAEDTYRDMLTDQYGTELSKGGGIGIASKLGQSLFDFKNIDHQTTTIMEAANAYNKIYNFK